MATAAHTKIVDAISRDLPLRLPGDTRILALTRCRSDSFTCPPESKRPAALGSGRGKSQRFKLTNQSVRSLLSVKAPRIISLNHRSAKANEIFLAQIALH